MLSFNLAIYASTLLPPLAAAYNESLCVATDLCQKVVKRRKLSAHIIATITTIRQNQLRAADNCVSRKSWHIRCLKQSNKYGDKENTAETARSTQVKPHYTPGLIYLALLRRQKWTFTSPNTNLGALQSICYLCINNW